MVRHALTLHGGSTERRASVFKRPDIEFSEIRSQAGFLHKRPDHPSGLPAHCPAVLPNGRAFLSEARLALRAMHQSTHLKPGRLSLVHSNKHIRGRWGQ